MPLRHGDTPVSLDPGHRAALVVGHPGHELKVFGWIAQTRPRVYVLTDGSGRHGVSRLPSTAKLLNQLGAPTDGFFGVLSDQDMYHAILDRRASLFLKLLDSLKNSLVANEIEFVAGDAYEGYNPTHDLCRVLINAAVEMAEAETGRAIANYQFNLADSEPQCPAVHASHDRSCLHLHLEDKALNAKINAATDYSEMKDEVEKALRVRGREYFRTERLKKAELWTHPENGTRPFYEDFGEMRVKQGEYPAVVRFQKHVLPIMEAIRNRAATRAPRHAASSLRAL
jgi:hypothetical protein